MTTTRLTLTVDVLDLGPLYTAGMAVGLLRGAGLTITGVVVDDEVQAPEPMAEAVAFADACMDLLDEALAVQPEGDIAAEDLPADVTPAGDGTSWAGRRRSPGPKGATRQAVLHHLATHGGSFEDAEGRVGPRLLAAVGSEATLSGFTGVLAHMERDGLITRRVEGKRTYAVQITGKGREHLVDADEPAPAAEPEAPDERPVTFTVDPPAEAAEEEPDTDDPARRFEERLARRRPSERRNFGTPPAPAGPKPVFPTVGPIERRPFNPDDVRYASIENANPR